MKKIVAFDCFDTLVHRDCHPEIILFFWAREVSAFLKYEVTQEDVYLCRKNAEKELKKEREDISYEELIKKFFNDIKFKGKMQINIKDFLAFSYNIEKDIEMQHLYIDKKNVEYLKQMYNQGDKIIIISDFYMPVIFFESVFAFFEIDGYISEIFVSSEIGMRKSTGNLYKYVLNLSQIAAKDMTMVGDNKITDCKIPQKLGIKTVLVRCRKKVKKNNYHDLKKEIISLAKVKKDRVFNGYVGIVYAFCERLYIESCKNNVNILLFCSREGQNLKNVFEIYQKHLHPSRLFSTKYLYVSRRSTLLPSLKELEEERFDRVFRQYKELIIKDFFFTIGFDNEEIKHIGINESDFDRVISFGDGFLNELKQNKEFLFLYDRKRKRQKEFLKEYLCELNNYNLDKIALVDIGWKGTIQDNIFEALDEKVSIIGFYFGILNHTHSEKNRKIGLMFDTNKRIKYSDIFFHNYIDLEKVFAATHGPTVEYKKEGEGNVIPVLLSDEKDVAIYKYVVNWQNNFNLVFHKLCIEFQKSLFSSETLLKIIATSYLKEQCVYRPCYDEIYLNFREKVKENFGNLSGKKLKEENTSINDKLSKKQFAYVDYIYRVLNQIHLRVLFPLAGLYCWLVYTIKKINLED